MRGQFRAARGAVSCFQFFPRDRERIGGIERLMAEETRGTALVTVITSVIDLGSIVKSATTVSPIEA